MRIALACALVVVAVTSVEARPFTRTYAEMSRVPEADVVEVRAVELEGAPFTHVLVGRFRRAKRIHGTAILVRCDDRSCNGPTTSLGSSPSDEANASRAELVALVDLAGAPGPLKDTLTGAGTPRLSTGKLAWPALVVRFSEHHKATSTSKHGSAVTGNESHGHLAILSLAPADAAAPMVFGGSTEDRSATGAGTVTSYELVAAAAPRPGKALDLRGMMKRKIEHTSRCLERPAVPVDHALVEKDGVRRYEMVGLPNLRGC